VSERITDPEVLADLRRRSDSERDRTRTREPMFGIVEHWPCADCGEMVGVGQLALDVRDTMNRELERRRQPLIPKRALCDECKRREDEAKAAQRRPHRQTEIAGAAPADERPSWISTPRAERNRRRNSR